nr:hypothetical protein [uncultured Carboxylicivirga sp.]
MDLYLETKDEIEELEEKTISKRKEMLKLQGKVKWDGNLDEMCSE